MKRQFRAFIVLISCFMTMLLLSPLACWADQNVGSNDRVGNVGVSAPTADRQTQAAPVLESGIAT